MFGLLTFSGRKADSVLVAGRTPLQASLANDLNISAKLASSSMQFAGAVLTFAVI